MVRSSLKAGAHVVQLEVPGVECRPDLDFRQSTRKTSEFGGVWRAVHAHRLDNIDKAPEFAKLPVTGFDVLGRVDQQDSLVSAWPLKN